MAQPIHNPFYALLLIVCGLLIVTMFICLMGFYNIPDPYTGEPKLAFVMPGLMKWIDRNAIKLITCQAGAIMVLGILAIGFDRFFEKRNLAATSVESEGNDESA